MRLWTLHPKYLDPQGLVALWREALLARAVLRGKTKGYRQHPQLLRFQSHPTPNAAINSYLAGIYAESRARGYRFDSRKFAGEQTGKRIDATSGQLAYEWRHLLRKLRRRSPTIFRQRRRLEKPRAHPIFRLGSGPIADWERQPGPFVPTRAGRALLIKSNIERSRSVRGKNRR